MRLNLGLGGLFVVEGPEMQIFASVLRQIAKKVALSA
jgi:hypothetical protein